MKVKVAELEGPGLDWAVAISNGIPKEELKLPRNKYESLFRYLRDEDGNLDGSYMTGPDLLFSRKWEAGGPIIERERVELIDDSPGWLARIDLWTRYGGSDDREILVGGSTPLIAAMRCYVASKLGDEVDIPEELGL